MSNLKRHHLLSRLLVTRVANAPSRGHLLIAGQMIPCALGRGGIARAKREGDGVTPAGGWRLLGGYFRAGFACRPQPFFKQTAQSDGWCDAPHHPQYNRPVKLPFQSSHEVMWRADRVYDLVVILDYNLSPRRQGRGSAIFFHLAHENYSPTAGCVAIKHKDMRRLLPRLARNCVMVIR